ncbi:MFS transporter [Streptomyces sp. enrichment culture]|uniref:MFS transporter n=1 Tax=Streptomyces sp. enrichment culture TaxID=1795815 RepID=UPI003F54C140
MFKGLIPPPGPPRGLALAQMVCRLGDGAYNICAALFFTRIVGLSPLQMSLGLTIGWSVALVLSVPLGHLADRAGPRGTAVVLFVCAALSILSFVFVSSFVPFVVASCVYAVSQRGGSAAEQALLAGLVPKDQVTRVRAYVQSSYNAGMTIGAGLGGLVLIFDSREAFYAAFVMNSFAFLVSAWILHRLPAVAPRPAARAGRTGTPDGRHDTSVFRDAPYVVLSVLNTFLLLYVPLIAVALPLWISEHTSAPVSLLSVMLMLNTIVVALFQVRVSEGVKDLASAARYLILGSFLLAAACVAFAFSAAGDSAWSAGVLLVVGAALMVFGEMMQAAGEWEASFGLAPKGKTGQYQAFFGNGITVSEMLGPLVLTGLIVYWGAPGWILLGVMFVVVSFAMTPVIRWGGRVRAEKERSEQEAETLHAVDAAPAPRGGEEGRDEPMEERL